MEDLLEFANALATESVLASGVKLIQGGSADPEEIARLQTTLEEIALEGRLPPVAQARIAQGARRLREARAFLGDDRAAALSDAALLLREARAALAGDEPASPVGWVDNRVAPDTADEDAKAERITEASLIDEFIAECRDYIDGAEAALLELETNPENDDELNTVFRAFHTIKGTSAFLGLEPITTLAHHAESLFSRFRDGELRCTGPRADLSLRAIDMLASLLRAAEASAATNDPLSPPAGYDELIRLLGDPGAEITDAEAFGALRQAPEPHLPERPRLGDILVAEGKADRKMIEAVAAKGEGPLGIALVREKVVSLTDVAQALRKQQGAERSDTSTATVRIRTDRLDELVAMVRDLVATRALVEADPMVAGRPESELARNVARASEIVLGIQGLAVSLRMVPLKSTFQRMARVARDAAKKSGRLIEFLTDGQDTTVDRAIMEGISDPLVHMIRNAVDHGLESPEHRERCGKPVVGVVHLAAYTSAGEVVLELRDDGQGLDRARIAEKAVAKGLIETDLGLSDAQVFDLVFSPGFSTADRVTDLSGRGVGLDVVKRNVEALGGRIEIQSEPGQGSTFSIRIPAVKHLHGSYTPRREPSARPQKAPHAAGSAGPGVELFTGSGRGEDDTARPGAGPAGGLGSGSSSGRGCRHFRQTSLAGGGVAAH